MSDPYILPDYVVKRLRYYDGQFLKDIEFIEEQQYHIDRKYRHDRLLHVAGIAEGLTVTANPDGTSVTVAPGTALDDRGRMILLAVATPVSLPIGASGMMYLEIGFREVATDPATYNNVTSETRFTQQPELAISATRTAGTVLLGALGIVQSPPSLWVNTAECTYSGLRLPGPGPTPLSLAASSDGNGAELSGALTVRGNLQVSGGNLDIGTNDSGVQRLLTVNGLVGIGTPAPALALVVSGGKVAIGYNNAAQTAGLAVSDSVGIGTANPNQALVINTGRVGIGFNDSAQTARLAVSGNVGIGTATPSQALVVNTGLRVGIGYNDSAQTAQLAVSGNVGIGTTTPASKLDVVGNVSTSGALTVGGNLNLGASTTVYLGTNRRIIHQYANNELWINQGNAGAEYKGGVHVSGVLYCPDGLSASSPKMFRIPHPLDPQKRDLVHACIEGPEAGVYYRGEGRLSNGKITVELPPYFEALTRKEGRTVILTPILEQRTRSCSVLAASRIQHGSFEVYAVTEGNPSQAFFWEVKAVRADVDPLEVEPDQDASIRGSSS